MPEGYGFTTDISAYNPNAIESCIVQGMRYYEANTSRFQNTLLYTQGYTGGAGWSIDWSAGIGSSAVIAGFDDVPVTAWYANTVEKAYNLGLMAGTGGSAFSPSSNLTIAEAIVLAARVNSISAGNRAEFPQAAVWYMPYVDYAISENIINADDFDNYGAVATRAQMAYIFAGALPEDKLEAKNTVSALPDVESDTQYFESIFVLYHAGVLQGSDSAGTFHPDSGITRAETSAIITRMLDITERPSFTY